MLERFRYFLVGALALGFVAQVQAQQKCSARGVMGGKKFSMTHCAVAFYDSEKSVTLWFAEEPISADEAKAFEWNSYPPDKDAGGKKRTKLHLSFCPGGGNPAPSAAAVKFVELGMDHAESPMLGRQWVFDLPKDKELKIENLSGELKLGGRLAGRMTGAKSSDGSPYSWQIDFDLKLPEKAAAAGTGCSGS